MRAKNQNDSLTKNQNDTSIFKKNFIFKKDLYLKFSK